jgi:mRNA interferase MazF
VTRGDLVTVAASGDFGKSHRALAVQSDLFADATSVTVLLLTNTPVEAPLIRIDVAPDATDGLRTRFQIMVDKATTVRREKVGPPIGHIDERTLAMVNRSLALFLGFA